MLTNMWMLGSFQIGKLYLTSHGLIPQVGYVSIGTIFFRMFTNLQVVRLWTNSLGNRQRRPEKWWTMRHVSKKWWCFQFLSSWLIDSWRQKYWSISYGKIVTQTMNNMNWFYKEDPLLLESLLEGLHTCIQDDNDVATVVLADLACWRRKSD